MIPEFKGFHEETLKFLVELKLNNRKEWFDENRKRYDRYIMEPSRAFVNSIGERLREISPDLMAEPRVNKSLFRLNRDVRFSPDRSPYQTHLGLIFWEGPRKRMECPGFYMQIDADQIMFAGGMYMLPKDLLEPYRKVVAEEGPAGELEDAVELVKSTGIEIGGQHYKRTPRNFQENHQYSYFLRYNGVYGMETIPVPDEFFNEALVDMAFERFQKIDPLNRWFLKYLY